MNRESSDTLYVGADLGGNELKVALVDSEGCIVAQNNVATEVKDAPGLIDHITSSIQSSIKNLTAGRVAAIGIGLPGLINRNQNKIEIFPKLQDVKIGRAH